MADTHLGFAAYRKYTESAYNQREEDILQAFRQVIDEILKIKPDLVLHAGDLFDVVRPTNRVLRSAIEQILRLCEARIPTIIISGNHETPKQRYLGSAFSILEILPVPKDLLYIIYKNEYALLQPFPQFSVHAIPQCTSDEIFTEQLKKVKKQPGHNILMLHAGVTGLKEFSHGDFNELLVDYNYLNQLDFDYVALGHYHGCVNVARSAWFSGSTERLSFNEAGQAKGFLEVEIGDETKVKPHRIQIRPMEELEPINAAGLDSIELSNKIEERIAACQPAGKILRLKINQVSSSVLASLDIKKIREWAAPALHFEPIFEKSAKEEGGEIVQTTSIGGLNEEYNSFLSNHAGLSDAEKAELKQLGQHYLTAVLEEET